MDATAVSTITRAQKDFPRPRWTEDTSSKAHLDTSVKRVMADHASRERCAYQNGLRPRFLQLMCNTSRDDLRPRLRKLVNLTK